MNLYFRSVVVTCAMMLTSVSAFGFEGSWNKHKDSVLELQGYMVPDGNRCEALNVDIQDSHVQFKLRCGAIYQTKMYSFSKAQDNIRIQRKGNTLLVTKYGFYGHKVQTRRDSVKMLNIPFVNEILRIENLDSDGISLYHETFQADALGRIVTQTSVQAVELKASRRQEDGNGVAPSKVSAREKRGRRPKRI